ncbi:hypothetical protein LCGC14_2336870 [marine sediment metagenome]|uniref:Uncharacterized protein n=1 Tax=marine sediment metagenome TaxID=412755 RepID=A0A0F9CE43_9ZZZZ
MDFKDLALHFWEQAVSSCWEVEFGTSSMAKSFEQCWEEFNER